MFHVKSAAKAALQLKFLLELEVELSTGSTETYFKQLVWHYDPNSIASEFPADWSRLAEHRLRDPLRHALVREVPAEDGGGRGAWKRLERGVDASEAGDLERLTSRLAETGFQGVLLIAMLGVTVISRKHSEEGTK